jgi:hypothetical protein
MLLSTPVEALVRLIKSAANAKTAWTALKTDVVGRDKVRRHEINRESREFRQREGESFMLNCDRAADHLSKVEAVGGSKETTSFWVCQNPSVPRTCHVRPNMQMTMALKPYHLKCASASIMCCA